MIFGLEQEGGSLITPMALAHPLHPIDNRSRNKRRNLWVGRCVSSWWPWFPSRSSVLIYMYIYLYVHSLYEFCYRLYIQRECHSVLAKLHPITFYGGVRGSWAECHFLFSLVYQLCLALSFHVNRAYQSWVKTHLKFDLENQVSRSWVRSHFKVTMWV